MSTWRWITWVRVPVSLPAVLPYNGQQLFNTCPNWRGRCFTRDVMQDVCLCAGLRRRFLFWISKYVGYIATWIKKHDIWYIWYIYIHIIRICVYLYIEAYDMIGDSLKGLKKVWKRPGLHNHPPDSSWTPPEPVALRGLKSQPLVGVKGRNLRRFIFFRWGNRCIIESETLKTEGNVVDAISWFLGFNGVIFRMYRGVSVGSFAWASSQPVPKRQGEGGWNSAIHPIGVRKPQTYFCTI